MSASAGADELSTVASTTEFAAGVASKVSAASDQPDWCPVDSNARPQWIVTCRAEKSHRACEFAPRCNVPSGRRIRQGPSAAVLSKQSCGSTSPGPVIRHEPVAAPSSLTANTPDPWSSLVFAASALAEIDDQTRKTTTNVQIILDIAIHFLRTELSRQCPGIAQDHPDYAVFYRIDARVSGGRDARCGCRVSGVGQEGAGKTVSGHATTPSTQYPVLSAQCPVRSTQ